MTGLAKRKLGKGYANAPVTGKGSDVKQRDGTDSVASEVRINRDFPVVHSQMEWRCEPLGSEIFLITGREKIAIRKSGEGRSMLDAEPA